MKRRILVVDDEWGIRELLRFRLSLRGYEVRIAGNEKEFLQEAWTHKPDLILLDIWLEGKTGTEVYNHLLKEGFDRNVPVIFITALGEDLNQRKASSGEKYALYRKPFDFEELTEEIKRLLCLASRWIEESRERLLSDLSFGTDGGGP